MSSTLSVLSVLLILSGSVSSPKLVVPNFSDLTIKTRLVSDGRFSSVRTLYLKGSRQRSEHFTDAVPVGTSFVMITQCDRRLRLTLDEKEKTYASTPIEDWSERIRRARPIPQGELTGAEVTITIDSVDTGERRQLGSYQARRVKTTTKVDPGPGAAAQASVTEIDGWYVDLPGFGCQDSSRVGAGWLGTFAGKRDRMIFKRRGTAPRGFAIEETSIKTESGRTFTSKVDLLEMSEAPLATSLFEIPPSYAPALRLPDGGYDMTKPDTPGNRARAYWAFLTASVEQWLRPACTYRK